MGNVWLHCKCMGVSDDIVIVNIHIKNIVRLEEEPWKEPELRTPKEIHIKPIRLQR